MKTTITILLITTLTFASLAQDTSSSIFGTTSSSSSASKSTSGWRLMSLSGEFYANSFYTQRNWTLQNFNETNKSAYISGGLLLNSRSFVWHPNFLLLDVGIEYNPGRHQESYLLIPSLAEVNSRKKLDVGATLFSSKKITLKGFASLNESYNNRENLINIKSRSIMRGGSVVLRNKIFPLSVIYQETDWKQSELETNRTYESFIKSLQSKVVKSFTPFDRNELSYDYNDYVYEYLLALNENVSKTSLNTTNRVSLFDNIYFDSLKRYNFKSLATYFTQQGDFELKRFRAFETVTLDLPKNFRSVSNYEYFNIKQVAQNLGQHRINTDLGHKLYLSLRTNVFFEYVKINQTFYNEYNYRGGISLAYEKKIPTDGRFALSYKYFRYHEDMKSSPQALTIYNEQHILNDAGIELLDKPYITLSSIVVRDATNTVIYQLNLDYTLIQMNNFVEIRRIPGGQIADGGAVSVDYQAIQPGDYNYDANNHSFTANISLFHRIIEFYYTRNQQDYTNIRQADFLTLNYLTQNIIGTRVRLKFGSAGVEYDNYNSVVVPYKMMRYYIQLQKNINNKLLLSLNGNMRDYKLINNTTNQTYIDVSTRMAYEIKRQTKVSLDVGYQNQKGESIDLDLLTSKAEFTTIVRQLYLTLGVQAYRRYYLSEKSNLYGAYFRITRKFNYK